MDDLEPVFDAVSRYFALLSEPMRLRILHAICQKEKTVSQIVEETGATQTNVSRHLGSMHRAGVLTRRKEGSFIWYGVGDPALVDICRTVCIRIAGQMETDAADRTKVISLARRLEGAGAGRPRTTRPATNAKAARR